jgi:alpha-amylase
LLVKTRRTRTSQSSFNHRLCLILISLLAAGPVFAQGEDPSFWQGQSIYQIFTDRFFDGNAANNNASGSFNAASGTGVHGGDFQGIEQKLDYIKSLGFTAIWLSPIVLNGNGEYHGYAAKNFYQVDPHWGTLSNLQSMVTAAHAKGLLVIQDVVVNHGGNLIETTTGDTSFNPGGYSLRYVSSGNQYAAPFQTNAIFPNLTNLFHNYGNIEDYGFDNQVEQGELLGLDDLRTELPYVRTNMAAIYNYWIQTAGFDGFRVDTVKHVEMEFWEDWCPRIHEFAATNGKPNFFMFGEVFGSSDFKTGSYTGRMSTDTYKFDSVLDFQLYYRINDVFATASSSTYPLEGHFNDIPFYYDPDSQMRLVTFIDNHDVPRFLSIPGSSTNCLALALTFQLTSRGIPCVYYGTEQGFNGDSDPNNREDMFDGIFEQGPSLGDNFNMTHPLYQHIAKLNNFRRLYPALRIGAHNNLWYDGDGPGRFAYSRTLGTQSVFVVFNTAANSRTLPPRPTIHPPGTVLINLLATNETIVIDGSSQTPNIDVPSTTAKLFVAQSDWRRLDPVVTSVSPVHDAKNISRYSPVVLQFTEPMDTNTVQTAFSTLPAVGGNFVWNGARDRLTFNPTNTWPGSSSVTVRIAGTAKSASSTNRLYDTFESRFATAATLPAIILTNVTRLSDGSVRFSFTNTTGATFAALTATNVALPASNWTVLGNVPEIAPSQFQFTAPPPTNGFPNFYRVRWP